MVYGQLIQYLNDIGDVRLVDFVRSASQSLAQLNSILSTEIDSGLANKMLRGIRQGLRETPIVLSSIVPDRADKLVMEFEALLGRRLLDL